MNYEVHRIHHDYEVRIGEQHTRPRGRENWYVPVANQLLSLIAGLPEYANKTFKVIDRCGRYPPTYLIHEERQGKYGFYPKHVEPLIIGPLPVLQMDDSSK